MTLVEQPLQIEEQIHNYYDDDRKVTLTIAEIRRELRDRERRGLRRVIMKGLDNELLQSLISTSEIEKMKNPVLTLKLNSEDKLLEYEFKDQREDKKISTQGVE